MQLLKKIVPLVLSLALFIAVSAAVRTQLPALEAALSDPASRWMAMALYVLLGIASVIVPFTSLIPAVPAAVALWGWPVTSALTFVSWVIGGQILFEVSRALGRGAVERLAGKAQLESIGTVLRRKGLWQSIIVRLLIQSDLLSCAFAVFTTMTRWEFLVVNATGVALWAVAYAYFGVLSIAWQVMGAGVICILAFGYWLFWERALHGEGRMHLRL